ncbi:hypothetical protein BJA01nite_79580 [Bradyrhizobium japonicum]|nr:hypothetical protein BJA01nite_79580 [Bradyrhizobium japonicum]
MWHEAARDDGAVALGAMGLAGGGANWAEAVAEHARSATVAIANRVWSIGVPAGRAGVDSREV